MYPQVIQPLVVSAVPPIVQVYKGDPTFQFATDPTTGNLVPTGGALNYNNAASYSIVTQACQGGYSSGWVRMQSQAGAASGNTFSHTLVGLFAHRQLVKVQVQAIGGANDGLIFDGIGTGGRTDDLTAPYSGVVYARNDTCIRVWAPSRNDGNPSGVMTHLGNGWGAEAAYQSSSTASVRVTTMREATPDFDSGWLPFSAQNGTSSYLEVPHYMNGMPLQVRVLVQAVDGANAGFIFEGVGAAPGSDEVGKYGGVVFGYNGSIVRIWAPSARAGKQPTGYMAFVEDGWAGNASAQLSLVGNVRVQVWKDPGVGEYFDSGWFSMASGTTNMSFFELAHPLQTVPARVQVMVQATNGPNAGFVFEGMGSALNGGNAGSNYFGGVVYGYDATRVRLWAPTADPISQSNNGRILFVGHGWGGEVNSMSLSTAMVRVRAFRTVLGVCDSSQTNINVNEVLRPPRASDVTFNIFSGLPANYVLGQLVGTGRDASSILSYSIVAGNGNGTFAVDSSSGRVTLARAQDINYFNRAQYNIAVRVFDGVSSDVAAITVNVLNTNRPPHMLPGQVVSVLETAIANTLIGRPINFTDPDVGQTHLFYLQKLVPNTQPPPFKLDICTGQIRMADPTGLDYYVNRTYKMTVMVMDDGAPPLNDTGIVTIGLIHANHAPVCKTSMTVHIDEHTPVGTLGRERLNFTDRDGDSVVWKVIGGTGSFVVDVVPGTGYLRVIRAVLDYQAQPSYDVIVTATDNGVPPLQCVPVDVTLQLIQVPEAPVWPYPPQVVQVHENVPLGTLVGMIQATDPDGPANDVITYSLVGSWPQLHIGASGLLTTAGLINYEKLLPPFYSIFPLVRAMDSLNLSAVSTMLINNQTVQLVQVQVTNVNDPPLLSVTNFSIPENVPVGTTVAALYHGRSTDPITDEDFGDFVTATVLSPAGSATVPFVMRYYSSGGVQVGDLVTAGSINFEQVPVWHFQLSLTDSGIVSPQITVLYNVSVTVIDMDDPPVFHCPRNSSLWNVVAASDAMPNMISTPGTQQQGGSIAFLGSATRGGSVITSAAACAAACKASRPPSFDCWAWSWYGPGYYASAFQSQCYGRTSTQTVTPAAMVGVDVTSGVRTYMCEMFTVRADATGAFGLPILVTDEDVGDYDTLWIAAGNSGAVQINNSSGQLSVVPGHSLDYFNYPLLYLTISAHDNRYQYKPIPVPAMTSAAFVVNTTHVNVAPVVVNNTATLTTLSAAGTTVGNAMHAVDLQNFPISCSIASSTAPAGLLTIDPVSCQVYLLTLMPAGGLYAAGSLYVLRVRATSSIGMYGTGTMTISVVAGVVPPVFNAASLAASWPENNASVSLRVVATDPGKTLSFSITATQCGRFPKTLGAGNFVIDPAMGVVTLIPGFTLDYEVTASCNVIVRATDNVLPVAAFAEATVVINVTNVNDPPVCPAALNYTSLNENVPVGTMLAPGIVCSDEDFNSYINFTVTGTMSTFALTSAIKSTQLRTTAIMNYETKQAVYQMMVTGCDNGLNGVNIICVRVPVWVFLVPVYEPPVIHSSNFTVLGNASTFDAVGTLAGVADAGDIPSIVLSWAFVTNPADPTNAGLCSSAAFVIAGAQVKVGQVGINYWRCTRYALYISATDPIHGLAATALVTFTVTPVNNLAVSDISYPAGGLRTQGGEVVNITGSNLGPISGALFDVAVSATYGPTGKEYTAASCRVVVKNTLIQCISAAGVGARHFWTLSLSGNGLVWTVSSSAAKKYSAYAPPVISGLATAKSITRLSTLGGDVVAISGSNMGPLGTAVTAIFAAPGGVNLILQGCSVFTAHGAISCTVPPGVGMSMAWQVTCGGLTSAWSAVTSSYAPPVITSVTTPSPRAMSTAGGESIALQGTDFGPVLITTLLSNGTTSVQPAPAVAVTYLNTVSQTYAPACQVVQSGLGTRIQCSSAAGIGLGLNFSVTVGGQLSPVFPTTLQYAPPVISGVTGLEQADTQGGQLLTLVGLNYGPWPSGVQTVTYGHTASEYVAASCVVVSQTVVTCRAVQGVGKNLAFRIAIGGQVSPDLATSESYSPPSVAWFNGTGAANAATPGGQVVLVEGRNFGFDNSLLTRVTYTWAAVGHNWTFAAASCMISVPHTELTCTTAQGAGAALAWAVTVDGQVSTAPSTSYAKPAISGVTTASGGAVTAASTDGGDTIYLTGIDFGPPSSSNMDITRRLQYGVSGVEYEVKNFTVLSHSSVRMVTVPGVGSNLLFTLTIAGQASAVVTLPATMMSYALPRVHSVSPSHGPCDSSASPITITLTGTNFGLLVPSVLVSVVFGNAVDGTTVVLPVLTTVPTPASHAGYVPGVSQQVVTFTLPRGVGASRGVSVAVLDTSTGARVASVPRLDGAYFSFDDPVLTYVDARAYSNENLGNVTLPNVTSASSLLVLVLNGKNFGVPPPGSLVDRQIWLQPHDESGNPLPGTPMSGNGIAAYSWSDVAIYCITTYHYGAVSVRITSMLDAGGSGSSSVNVIQGSGASSFADVSPAIANLNGGVARTWSTAGGETMTIVALFLGSAVNLEVTFGPGNCTIVYPLDYATVSLRGTPMPASAVRPVLIAPFIKDVQAASDTWTITCVTPPGQGANLPVLLVRDGKASPADAQLVSYTPPSLAAITVLVSGSYERSVNPNEPCVPSSPGCSRVVVATDGSSILSLTGSNFGVCPIVTVVASVINFCHLPLPVGAVRGRALSAVRPGLVSISSAVSGHEYLEVPVPPGEGGVGANAYFVTVAAGATQSSRETWRVRYSAPTISRVYSVGSPGSCACPSCAPGQAAPECALAGTAGGDTVVIFGANFGASVTGGGALSDVQVTIVGVGACIVTSRNHTTIMCAAPAGDGVNHDVTVNIAGQAATRLPALSYAPPVITAINVTGEALTAGGFNFTITGTNFGVRADSSCVFMMWPYRPNMAPPNCLTRANLASLAAQGAATNLRDDFLGEGELPGWRIRAQTHSTIIVTAPPGGGVRQVAVTINGQTSGLVGFTYAPPVVYSMTPVMGGTLGGDVVTLQGRNFGQAAVAAVNYGNGPLSIGDPLPMSGTRVDFFHSCVSNAIVGSTGRAFPGTESCVGGHIVSHSHTALAFKTLPGVGANKTVTVSVLDGVGVSASNGAVWSFFPPTLNSVMPNQISEDLSVSYTNIDVRGSNFGTFESAWTADESELQMSISDILCEFPYRKTTTSGGNFATLSCQVCARALSAGCLETCKQAVWRACAGVRVCDSVCVCVDMHAREKWFCCVQMGGLTVGWKDLNVSVAMQTTVMPQSVLVGCAKGFYGQINEWCLTCPQGATCLGYLNDVNYEPVSNPGWFMLSSPCDQVYKDPADAAKRADRSTCPDLVPCMPLASCTGNNTCLKGYRSVPPMYRCAACADRYYRRAGDCVACPDNAAILIIGFAVLALFITVGGYVLSRKNVHLAFLNISVDYFQVLAMFANSKVAWPPQVRFV